MTTILIDHLRASWGHGLSDLTHDFPAFGGMRSCGDVVDHMRTLEPGAERDRLMLALVAQAQDGDHVADTCLMLMMVPACFKLAKGFSASGPDSTMPARLNAAYTALWEAVHTFGLHRTESVFSGIYLDALHLLTSTPALRRQRTSGVEEVPLSIVECDQQPEHNGLKEAVGAWEPDPILDDLAAVLAWSIRERVLTEDNVRLLATVMLGEPDQVEALADAEGLSVEALQRRARRFRSRLQDRVRSFIQHYGARPTDI